MKRYCPGWFLMAYVGFMLACLAALVLSILVGVAFLIVGGNL
jgi:hypothetical protein